MKLLTIFPAQVWGGAETHALTIAIAAKQLSWEVHVGFPNTPGTTRLIQAFSVAGIEYHRLQVPSVSGSKLDALKSNFSYFKATIALIKQLRPDIVHVSIPGLDHSLIALVACAVLNIPVVAVFHLISIQRNFSPYRRGIYTWAKSKHQQWVAVSQSVQRQVSQIFQIPLDAIQVIPNGIKPYSKLKPDHYTQNELRHQILQELSLPDNSQIAITVGRLTPQKGYHDLLEIIPQLRLAFPNLKFIWAGEGEQREALEQRIQTLDLTDTVFLLGQRSDVLNLLHAADLFIFPTYFEGLPFALLEAMACGLPIVASDASSIPELITPGVQGYLFPVGDRAALLTAINWMLDHPEQGQQMGVAAQIRSQEFTEENMINRTIATLNRVAFLKQE